MRKFLIFQLGFLVIAALSFALPARYGVQYPKPLGPALAVYTRQTYRQDIEAQRPAIVIMGDSMMLEGVDREALAAGTGKPVYRIAMPGSASAAWYLVTRHNVVTADPPPQVLIIFFRDTILTAPGYRVSGTYYTDIVYENTAPDDMLFLQYAFIDRMSLPAQLAESYLPLFGQRLDVRKAIDYRLRYMLPRLVLDCENDCTNAAMDNIFNAANMQPGMLGDAIATAERYLYTPENLNFPARVDRSFLPEIIRLTRERGIRLVLVRFKTLVFPNRAAEPRALQEYMRDLRAYLAENDVPLLDYSDDDRVITEYYADALHMTPAGQAAFTLILATDLRPILEGIP